MVVGPRRTAALQIIVIQRLLPYCPGECGREPAARIRPAEHSVGNGMAGFAAGIPYIEDGRNVLAFPVEYQRTPGKQQEHHRLACGDKFFQQVTLRIGNSDIGA